MYISIPPAQETAIFLLVIYLYFVSLQTNKHLKKQVQFELEF